MRVGSAHVWYMDKSIPVFRLHNALCLPAVLRNYQKQRCSRVPPVDQDQAAVPMADQQGLAHIELLSRRSTSTKLDQHKYGPYSYHTFDQTKKRCISLHVLFTMAGNDNCLIPLCFF